MVKAPDTQLSAPQGHELDSVGEEILLLASQLALPPIKKRIGEFVIDRLDLFSNGGGIFGPSAITRTDEAVYRNPAHKDGLAVVSTARTRTKEPSMGVSGGWYGKELAARVDITQPRTALDGSTAQETVLSAVFNDYFDRDAQADDTEILSILKQIQEAPELVSRTSSRDTN